MSSPPTSTMVDALAAMFQAGGLVRYAGGYWAAAGAPRDHNGIPQPHWGTSTIEGCVKRGAASYTQWRTGRNGQFPIRVECVTA